MSDYGYVEISYADCKVGDEYSFCGDSWHEVKVIPDGVEVKGCSLKHRRRIVAPEGMRIMGFGEDCPADDSMKSYKYTCDGVNWFAGAGGVPARVWVNYPTIENILAIATPVKKEDLKANNRPTVSAPAGYQWVSGDGEKIQSDWLMWFWPNNTNGWVDTSTAVGDDVKKWSAWYFCRPIQKPAYGSIEEAAAILSQIKFHYGDSVRKIGGDYTFEGIVVSVFAKLSGKVRYVVEDDRGVLHVYGEKNLEAR